MVEHGAARAAALDSFPDVHFSDPRVKLADMTGDGLTDIVFVDGGRLDYWPSLGHGRWGRRVTMSGQLTFPDVLAYGGAGFDPKRLLLGDVDGDGLADLVYVESGRITIWLNQSGNRWGEPIVVRGTPPIADPDCRAARRHAGHGHRRDPLDVRRAGIRGQHVQVPRSDGQLRNRTCCANATTTLVRARTSSIPSTRYSLVDEPRLETRWRARLPFPVQVVSRVQAIDAISGGKLSTEYRYHQGAWDGVEREFRGFGVVDQLDSETFTRDGADTVRFAPPTLTRTWFHQGSLQDRSGAVVRGRSVG